MGKKQVAVRINVLITLLCFLFFGASELNKGAIANDAPDVRTFVVEPQLVDCVGEGQTKCMMINGEYFYDQISGFAYEEGYSYVLEVELTNLPPEQILEDGSSIEYRLIREVSRTEAD